MIISCPECKNQVSDQADSCPHCGFKIATAKKNDAASIIPQQERKRSWKLPLFVISILIASLFLYSSVTGQRAEAESVASIPELPVLISTRESLLGAGMVAVFENNSSNEFAVIAEFTNPGINAAKTVRIDLPAKTKIEVGHLEGWRFQSGDTIKLSNDHYKELFAVVP